MFSVSVIVPTCDRPALLERALRSVAGQEFAPLEIIVVDDTGSQRRDLVRHVDRLDISSVHIVANAHGKGVSGARNTGAELAAGELLAFLDDDDEWLPSYLSKATRQFESGDLEVLCGDLLCQFHDGVDRPGKAAPDRLLPESFLTGNPGLMGSNLILTKSLYQTIGGFDESLLAAEDSDLGLRLSLRNGVKYGRLSQRLVRIHQHSGARLTTPASAAMSAGIRRFYELHSERMTPAQQEGFRINARYYFRIDEWGRECNSHPNDRADLLIRSLKDWLDQKKGEHDSNP
jgi:glycosyltransferase involved in cell wall biosynthesis